MKIAVAYEHGQVFQHFGHTAQFKVYDVQDGKIQSTSIVNTDGNGHCGLADVLKQNGVDALICGGIGFGAKQALMASGITLYGGVIGNADKAVEALLTNKLVFSPNEQCTHHHHNHTDDGQHCGSGHCAGQPH
ncbi:MAG: NifB/NifX family molybdenum-iron cluster-binding protein [Nitrososphaerota archaeon]|jgi:predicted Fe-Mo cluster-binding NifX family protein|nr:NifB/NifX family molybdenum-iron cluster-binding protein [Nitrososphaerota archaeon]